MRNWALGALVVGVAGCQFGAPGGNDVPDALGEEGSGGDGVATTGDGDGDGGEVGDATSGGIGESGDGDATSAATTNGDAMDDDTAAASDTMTPVPDGPNLVLSDAPLFDFGGVALLGSSEHAFTVTNTGDETALAISAGALPVPFSYSAAGTCVGTLDPGASCTIAVMFGPTTPGWADASLDVTYDGGGIVTVGLHGGGVGSSPNLLVNPGGETPGNPPSSWAEASGTDWHTYDGGVAAPGSGVAPHSGAQSFFAGTGSTGLLDFALDQVVDVSAWATTIDGGALQYDATSWIRAVENNNNFGRVVVVFHAADGTPLTAEASAWYGGFAWSQLLATGFVPTGTRSIRFRFHGVKSNGETQCDAYFDDASVSVRYP